MFFADFTKLKIITDYNYIHKPLSLTIAQDTPIKEIMEQVKSLIQPYKDKTSIPVLYDFTVAAAWLEDYSEQELVEYLVGLANIVVPVVLKELETGKGYGRERRLDVPEKLKPLHSSFGAIKRACNNEIYTPVINIKLDFNNVSYMFCMGREIDEVKQEEEGNE